METSVAVSSTGLRALRNSPALPALLQRLHPKVIGRIIGEIGLHDAGELMALTPRAKLLAVFDESIWRRPAVGSEDVLDVSELVDWLDVWIDVGEAFTADCLAAMSDEYLALCMAQLIHVADADATAYNRYSDPESSGDPDEEGNPDAALCERFGSYLVYGIVADESDIVRRVLNALCDDAPDRLLRILAILAAPESMLAPSDPRAGLDHDISFERQRYREHQGYVTASGARAFLAFGTTASIEELLTLAEYDNESLRYLGRHLGQHLGRHLSDSSGVPGQHNPVEAGAPEAVDTEDAGDPMPAMLDGAKNEAPDRELDTHTAEELQSLLQHLQPASATFLLEDHRKQRLLPVLKLLDALATEDYAAFEQRERELAYLANVVISALRSNDAPLDAASARSMAVATCNLGLELLQAKQVSVDLAREPGLLRLFLIGWRSLHELPERVRQACERAAATANLTVPWQRWLSEQVTVGLADLTNALELRNFAAAREAAIFLSIAFDRSSCCAMRPLLDEIPRFPASLEGSAQPLDARWLEGIQDLNHVAALLSKLTFRP